MSKRKNRMESNGKANGTNGTKHSNGFHYSDGNKLKSAATKSPSPSLSWLRYLCILLVHAAGFAVNGGGLTWDLMYISVNGESTWKYRGYGGKFKHITFWCQIIQSVYFGLALVNDIFGSNEGPNSKRQRSFLQKTRDWLLTCIAFPVGAFVVLTFWGIYAIDRELVFPKVLDAIIPTWFNHIMHTTVIVFLLLEKFVVYHWHQPRAKGLFYTLGFTAIYQVWILWIAYYAEIWVYPILQVMNTQMRVTFFAALWVVIIMLYLFGELMTNVIWGSPKALKKKQR